MKFNYKDILLNTNTSLRASNIQAQISRFHPLREKKELNSHPMGHSASRQRLDHVPRRHCSFPAIPSKVPFTNPTCYATPVVSAYFVLPPSPCYHYFSCFRLTSYTHTISSNNATHQSNKKHSQDLTSTQVWWEIRDYAGQRRRPRPIAICQTSEERKTCSTCGRYRDFFR